MYIFLLSNKNQSRDSVEIHQMSHNPDIGFTEQLTGNLCATVTFVSGLYLFLYMSRVADAVHLLNNSTTNKKNEP